MTRSTEQHFLRFAEATKETSPLYASLSQDAAGDEEICNIFESANEDKREPVLFFAALHFLLLSEPDEVLLPVWQGGLYDSNAIFAAFRDYCMAHAEHVVDTMNRKVVQTNEVNRCTTLAMGLSAAMRLGFRPTALIDIGTSAGLNLHFDRYHIELSDGRCIGDPNSLVRLRSEVIGLKPPLSDDLPGLAYRTGIDVAPIDVNDDAEHTWLRACVWPGDSVRRQRLESALKIARTAPPNVLAGDATVDLPELIGSLPAHAEVFVFSSWAMGWMTSEQRDTLLSSIQDIAKHRDVALLMLERGEIFAHPLDGGAKPSCSFLVLRRYANGSVSERLLGLAQHHGNWIDWQDKETAETTEA